LARVRIPVQYVVGSGFAVREEYVTLVRMVFTG
jgi:hypothetical protein